MRRRERSCGPFVAHTSVEPVPWSAPGSRVMPLDLRFPGWSGRRESNPHNQLGRVRLDPPRPVSSEVTGLSECP